MERTESTDEEIVQRLTGVHQALESRRKDLQER